MIDVGIVGVGTYLPEKTMKAAENCQTHQRSVERGRRYKQTRNKTEIFARSR